MTSVAGLLWLMVAGLFALNMTSAAAVDNADAVSDNVNGIPLSRHRRCLPQASKFCFMNGKTFGSAKMNDTDRAEIFRQLVCRCDIFVLLEVKDKSNASQKILRDLVNDTCGPIDMVLGERVGKTDYSKEMPVFYSKSNVVTPLSTLQYEDVNGNFSRPPFGVAYGYVGNNMTIGIQALHATTTGTELELEALYDAFVDFNATMFARHGTVDYFVGGDLNCDRPYVYPDEQAALRISDPALFYWGIEDGWDTTVTVSSDRTYDRILTTGHTLNYSCFHGYYDAFEFDQELTFPEGCEPLDISNHRVVEANCISGQ